MTVVKRSTKEILNQNLAREKPELLRQTSVWLHDIRSMYNVGSAFRTSDAFGVGNVQLSGYTPKPPRAEISKTALGAEKSMNWNHFTNGPEALMKYKDDYHHLVAIEQTNESKPLTDLQPSVNRPLILVFGSEVIGLDSKILNLCDEYIEIPQFGQKHSFNVSVTIGIVLYQVYLKNLEN